MNGDSDRTLRQKERRIHKLRKRIIHHTLQGNIPMADACQIKLRKMMEGYVEKFSNTPEVVVFT